MPQGLKLRDVVADQKEAFNPPRIDPPPGCPPPRRTARRRPTKVRLKGGVERDPFASHLIAWVTAHCGEPEWQSLLGRQGEPGAPPWLSAEALGLDGLSHRILLLAIAHLIHTQGDLNPSPFQAGEDLDGKCLLRHLCPSLPAPAGIFELAKRLAVDAPLRTRGYLFVENDWANRVRGGGNSITVSRFLRTDLSMNISALGPLLGLQTAQEDGEVTSLGDLVLPVGVRDTLNNLLRNPPPTDRPFWVYLKGPLQSGRRSLAEAVANRLGKPLRRTNMSDGPQPGTCLLVNISKHSDEEDWQMIRSHPGWIFLRPGEKNLSLKLETRADLVLDLAPIEAEARIQFWTKLLNTQTNALRSINPVEMAELDAAPGQIIDAVKKVAQAVEWMEMTPAQIQYRLGELLLEPIDESQGHEFAQRVVPQRTLQELCLEPEAMEKFTRIIQSIRGRSAMLSRWNLDPGLVGKAKGVLLAHGPSGSGKSMMAEVLAHELNLPLMRMVAAELESPFVGETENRIHKFLSGTKGKPSVILLDEADSMLMDRSSAEGSTRRYQINLVNCWLRELDDFEGILVFTTNHADGFDPALERRIMFRMEFKTPSREVRKRLWESLFQKAPIPGHNELDLSTVAQKYDFTGGRTRLAFMDALQRAAEVGSITQDILVEACEEENRSALPGKQKAKQIRGFASLQKGTV